MNVQELKARVVQAIDRRKEEIIALGEQIRVNPELGYKEHKTAALVEEIYKKLGLSYRSGLALTGSKAELPGGEHKVRVAVMGELDAVVCPEHPDADGKPGLPIRAVITHR